MNKKLLLFLFCLYGTDIYAGGLYLSSSYGKNKSSMFYDTVSEDSQTDYRRMKNSVGGFPGGRPNSEGWMADNFEAGLEEQHIYNIDKGNSFSFGVGWQIPKNPLRLEVEYEKLKSSVPGFTMNIYNPNGKVKYGKIEPNTITQPDGTVIPNPDPYAGKFKPTGEERLTSVYEFNINLMKPFSFSVDSIMANVLFEIPVLGAIDPYLGFGVGKVLIKNMPSEYSDLVGVYEGSDGYVSATQYIAGIEARLPETPFIFGVEYKQLSSKFMEKDDKLPFALNNKSLLFKVKYDFISDVI